MGKGFTAAVFVTIVAGLALGAGLAMYQSGALSAGKAGAQGQVAGDASGLAGNSTRGQGDQGASAARGFPGVTGTVESLVGSTLTVSTASGPVKITLTADTAIRKTTDIKPAELTVGESVTVIGTKGADGAIAARSLQVGENQMPASGNQSSATRQAGQGTGQGGRAAGQQGASGQLEQAGGPPGQAAFANVAQVVGTIESVATDKIGIKTAGGNVTVTLSDQTTLRKTVTAAVTDLAKGVTVMAGGQQGADGSLTATFVQIGAELGQGLRGTSTQGQ